jgi:hypothetical protein
MTVGVYLQGGRVVKATCLLKSRDDSLVDRSGSQHDLGAHLASTALHDRRWYEPVARFAYRVVQRLA